MATRHGRLRRTRGLPGWLAMSGIFPIVTFDRAPHRVVDRALSDWGHFLGPCKRPFGRQSFALAVDDQIVAVAVSSSTPNRRCGGFDRKEVVELSRLCAHPDHRDMTRVALRLWRKIAPAEWARAYWPVVACVSYADSTRHSGDIYRFDGWTRVADVRGGKGGGRQTGTVANPKSVWAYPVTATREPSAGM